VLEVALGAVALAATGAAVYTTAVSRHAPHPVTHEVLTVVVCFAFVGAGLLALRRRLYGSFGLLLAAVGFASLLGALHDANTRAPYAIGVLTSNLVFAVLVHALLAYPDGHLRSRASRVLVAVAYADVLVVQGVAVLFDPLTRWHSDHPGNLVLVDSHAALATVLEELEAAIAIAVAVAVAVILVRQLREATAPARRQLLPVVYGGTCGLLIFSVGLALAPVSSGAAVIGIGLGLLASLALPLAFVALLVRARLSRANASSLLVELMDGGLDLRDALRRALGDPLLELGRRGADGRPFDAGGRELVLPARGDRRAVTPIRHNGEHIGVLVHDASLRMRPELLEAVSAAAGFAVSNEAALETVEHVEERNRALVDAMPDPMILVARDGTYLDVRAEDPAGLVRPPEQLIGRNVRDVLPPELAERVVACIERALEHGESAIEYELEIDGVRHWKESRMVAGGDDEVVTIVRDFTEQRRAQAELRRLAAEQAALRRVATLVAADAPPEQVFQKVTEEVCEVLELHSVLMLRYEEEGTATIVGKFGEPHDDFLLGSLLRLTEGAALGVLRTAGPVHIDYREIESELAARMRALGFCSSVGVPVIVGGTIWGALIVGMRETERLHAETEQRLQAFAELAALALSSAHAREELAASRLRIVEAGDAARRRIERNLHDGAQQRLVALAMGLRIAQKKVRTDPQQAEEHLAFAAEELSEALQELRELAQGIHPAVLTDRGLATAIEVLAARTPLQVDLDVGIDVRLPDAVEATVYYVVSEALANVVKHARACAAAVRVSRRNGTVEVAVEDDGAGGADPTAGSGLRGLRDRVETLSGRLHVTSTPGRGTCVRAELPLR
jgi:PAS domain S-box-containing protein